MLIAFLNFLTLVCTLTLCTNTELTVSCLNSVSVSGWHLVKNIFLQGFDAHSDACDSCFFVLTKGNKLIPAGHPNIMLKTSFRHYSFGTKKSPF